MKLTFIGADHEVTGSCHYLNAAGKNILVDYGMEQGGNVYENAELPIPFSDVDYIFITHAHIDHTGLLPLIYAKGFKGQIFATQATCDLCNIMLKDSAHIQEMEAEWRNRKARRAGKTEVEQKGKTCRKPGGPGALHGKRRGRRFKAFRAMPLW